MSAPPHQPLTLHPRPILVMPSASPSLPAFLPHLQTASGHVPGRFLFPSAIGAFPSQLPSPPSLLLQSPSQPGLSRFPFFQHYLHQSADRPTTAPVNTDTSALQAYTSEHRETSPPPSQTLRSPSLLPQAEFPHGSSELVRESQESMDQESGTDNTSEHLVDVETSDDRDEDEEHDRVAFLEVRTHHHKQRKKKSQPNTADNIESSLFHSQEKYTRRKNEKGMDANNHPPALVNLNGKNGTTVSQVIECVEPAIRVITEDVFTSGLEKHNLYFEDPPDTKGRRYASWAKRVRKQVSQQSSSSIIDLPRLPTVICS